MLAINSDIDRTSPLRFREVHRFLNTREETPLGPGLGLDIADSLWFYRKSRVGPDPLSTELCYFHGNDWTAVSPYAEELLHYVRCGWIDTIHGYGNFTGLTAPDHRFTRRHAEEALAVLAREELTIPVWSNHGGPGNIQNIGPGAQMQGDDPTSPAYHADLLRKAGVVYLWGLGAATLPGAPTKLAVGRLRDGESWWEFTRFTSRGFEEAERDGLPRWQAETEAKRRKSAMLWLPRWLHVQLAEPVLRGLVDGGHFCIAAQHLGTARPMNVLGTPAADALRRLAELQEAGEILVARTARLLHYNRVRDNLRYTAEVGGDGLTIDVLAVDDPVLGESVPTVEELRGVTFGVEDARRTRLRVAGREIAPDLLRRSADETEETIGVEWYEPDYTDYSEPFKNDRRVLATDHETRKWNKAAGAAAEAAAGLPDRDQAVEAARLGYGPSLRKRIVVLRSLGFMDAEAVQLGCGAGEWCVALALAGVAQVTGVDSRPEFVDVARAAAEAAGVSEQCTFRVATEDSVDLPSESTEFVFWRSGAGFQSVELAMETASRLLRQNSALYATYATTAGLLHSIERSLAEANGAWRTAAADLMAEALCRHGMPTRGRTAPDLNDLLAIADSRGLALVDQPGLAQSDESFLGQPVTVEVMLRRERKPDWLLEELIAPAVDDALRRRIERLEEAGASRLVAEVLQARAAAGQEQLQLQALPHHSVPEERFRVGAGHLDLGDPAAAETAFREGLAEADAEPDHLIGLLAVAAARDDPEAAQDVFRRLSESIAAERSVAATAGDNGSSS